MSLMSYVHDCMAVQADSPTFSHLGSSASTARRTRGHLSSSSPCACTMSPLRYSLERSSVESVFTSDWNRLKGSRRITSLGSLSLFCKPYLHGIELIRRACRTTVEAPQDFADPCSEKAISDRERR
jgi:hypothetical protein